MNNLLQPQALNAWRDLNASEQQRAATKLLDTVEDSAFVLADNLLKTDIVRENTDNIRKRQSPNILGAPEGRIRVVKPDFSLQLEISVGCVLAIGVKNLEMFPKESKGIR